jgi:hypothetical protein
MKGERRFVECKRWISLTHCRFAVTYALVHVTDCVVFGEEKRTNERWMGLLSKHSWGIELRFLSLGPR